LNRLQKENGRGFPTMAGIFLGLGLGGFFDGIVLHQVLQWHHMLTSAGDPANNLDNLELNVMWDGLWNLQSCRGRHRSSIVGDPSRQ
jgi:uncharacterized membrane protein